MSRRTPILASLTLVGLLAACGSATSAGSTTSAPSKAAPSPTATTPAKKATLAECLVGRWAIDPASYDAMMTSMLGSAGASPKLNYTGTATTTFVADGTFTTDSNMSMALSMSVGKETFESSATSTGTATGTWTTDGSNLSSKVTQNGIKTTTTVKINGAPQDASGADGGPDGTLPEGTPVPATCTDTTLTLTLDVASALAAASGTAAPTGAPTTFAITYARA